MKDKNEKEKPIKAKPGLYTYFYEMLKICAARFGYNLVIHGSMDRDLDLIAIPWIADPMSELTMIKEFDRILTGRCFETRKEYLYKILPGGRKSYVISLNRGGKWNEYLDEEYYLDISITPLPDGRRRYYPEFVDVTQSVCQEKCKITGHGIGSSLCMTCKHIKESGTTHNGNSSKWIICDEIERARDGI